jgi:hypothetical protein
MLSENSDGSHTQIIHCQIIAEILELLAKGLYIRKLPHSFYSTGNGAARVPYLQKLHVNNH